MAEGDIGSVIASFEFDTSFCQYPDIIHISGNVYAISYAGMPGKLKTVSISDDGKTMSVIASLQFANLIYQSSIIHISGNVYAIAYRDRAAGEVYTGWLKTFSISDDGETLALVASLEFEPSNILYPRIIHVLGNVYAIAYRRGFGGRLTTVSISDDGATLALIAGLNFDSTCGVLPDIIHVSGNVYAVAYHGVADAGWLKTVSISDDGATLALIAGLELGSNPSEDPFILHVSGNIYAIAYSGKLKTVSISDDGETLSVVNTFGIRSGPYHMIRGSGNVFIIVIQDSYGDGWVATYSITPGGAISFIDQLEFEPVTAQMPNIIHVSGDVYAIPHFGTDSDGWLKTVDIETVVAPTVTTEPATNLATISATLNGTLDDDGGVVSDCGFEWGPDTGYGNTTPTQSKTTGETFSQVIHGLSPYTRYHFRAFGTNREGTGYGSDRSFITSPAISKAYALAREEL